MKKIIPILFYWCSFFIILFFALFLVKIGAGKKIDIPGYIFFFLLFLYPFLFFIPFKLSRIEKTVNRFLFTLIFLVIPYVLIYIYTYTSLRNAFGSITIL
jgi:hypothetical protein